MKLHAREAVTLDSLDRAVKRRSVRHERFARAWFVHDDPLPATVLAFFPIINTEDD